MALTSKYATDLLASFNLVVVHLAALKKQNAMLAEYHMPQQTNSTASMKWVVADALTDRTEEELNALYKNFNNISLKACAPSSASRDGLSDLLSQNLGQNLPSDNEKGQFFLLQELLLLLAN
ncbi:hypothetical protein EDC96DRAFT_608767 [Choanephora cucurbitarum]|nr:hypothetical protein EDC96DRAFT_608767 [Choanephora cucurbitarum]